MCRSRVVAPEGPICRSLRGSEAPGGPASNHAVAPGGCFFEEPQTSGQGLREAISDESLDDCVSGRFHLSYGTSRRFGGPTPAFNRAASPGGCPSKEAMTIAWELREAGSEECLHDGGSGSLHLLCSTRLGGPGKSRFGPSSSTRRVPFSRTSNIELRASGGWE